MAFRIKRKKVRINRVVVKVVATVIGLYVGGTIMTQLGSVMNCTCSAFYPGLSLIGWTIATNTPTTSGNCNATATTCGLARTVAHTNQITATTGSGILAVIGIIGIASIVTEFVEFSM